MDQRPDDIRQDVDSIRDSMTDKMAAIESKIKGTVEETTEAVKQTVDVKYQVSQRPWTALGIAVVAGYALGSLGGSDRDDYRPRYSSNYNSYDDHRDSNKVSYSGNGSSSSKTSSYSGASNYGSSSGYKASQPGFIDQMRDQFGDEIELLKGAAMASVVDLVRGAIKRNLPSLGSEIDRLSAQNSTNPTPPRYSTASGTMSTPSSRPVVNPVETSPSTSTSYGNGHSTTKY